MRQYALLLALLATTGCLGGPGYPASTPITSSTTPSTKPLEQSPTETPLPTIEPELSLPTPEGTSPPTAPPQTPEPTAPPEPIQQDLTLIWEYDTGFDVYGVGITEDGEMIVAGSGDFNLYAFNRTGGSLWQFKAFGAVNDVSITPKGDRIVATSYVTPNGTVYLLDSKGRLIWKRTLESFAKGVDISSDGDTIALGLGNGKIRVLDKNGKTLWDYETRHSAWGVWDVALKPDGGVVAGGDDTYFYILSPEGELIFNDSKGSGLYVHGVAVSEDGSYIGVASHGKRVGQEAFEAFIYLYQGTKLLWRYKTGRLNYGVALTKRGDLVAAGSWDKNLYLLNNRGELVVKYPMGSYVNRMAFSGDGKYLVAGTVDGGIHFFEVGQ
ncbi:MAG: PQQ-binding-like beta-propeller repeat protein [Candidatus Hydrothermarchaeaceae archaeon]